MEETDNSQLTTTATVTKAKSEKTNSKKCETTPCNKHVMYISKLMVGYPKTTMVFMVAFHLLFILITVVMTLTGYDLFPVNFSDIPLDLQNEQEFLRIKAWENRGNDGSVFPKSIVTAERTEKLDTLELFYQADNILTAEHLRHIENIEAELIQISGYEDFCQRDKRTNQCKKPSSILRFFDGSYGPHFSDPNYSRIPMKITMAMSSARMAEGLKVFLGKDTILNTTYAFSSTIRSFIYFGSPLSGHATTDDRKEDQENKLEQFLKNNYRDRLHSYHKNGVNGIGFLFFSKSLIANDIAEQFRSDMLLVIGSFAFLFLLMVFQTRSLFVSGVGLLAVFSSFIVSVLLYRVIYGYKYFGIFHLLSLFMMLCFGADGIFTYFDNWRATSHKHFASLEQRIAACFIRASGSLMATSLTTAVTFAVYALSPFLAVSSFGIFCTTLVLVNFLTSVTFLPTVIMIYHLCWVDWNWPCCMPCLRRKTHVSPSKRLDTNVKASKNCVVRFFVGPYFSVVTHKIVRWIIVFVSVVLICVFSYYASLLKPSKGAFEYLKADNNYVKAGVRRMHGYKPSAADQIIKVFLVWGLKPQDRSSCHNSEFNCPGRTVWDDKFDLDSKPAQIYLKALCDNILRMNDTMKRKLHVRNNSLTGQTEMQCFLANMESYLQNEGSRSVYNGSADFTLPLTNPKIIKLMEAHPEHFNTSTISSNTFHRFVETGLSFWLYDDYSTTRSSDFDDFNEYLGFSKDKFDTRPILSKTGYYYGTRLKYAAIIINTNLLIDNVEYQDGLPIMEAWEEFTKTEVEKLPISLSGGFQCTPERGYPWHYFKVQKVLVESTTRLLVLGICLSFVTITLATWNVILGFLATIIIGMNLTVVIGFISMMGWGLGTIEAVNLTYVIGLTVVYIVPLTKGYQTSSKPDRTGRVKEMVQRVCISTMSGASLKFGSLLFLCFAEIVIFMQFGAIMVCTVVFSFILSFGLFTALLGILGPQNHVGSIPHMYKWCLKRYRKKIEGIE